MGGLNGDCSRIEKGVAGRLAAKKIELNGESNVNESAVT